MANDQLSITKPVSVWNKPIKANWKDLFKALTKVAVSGVTGNISGIGENATEAVSAIGLGNEPGQIAWLLIYRSIQKAIYSLVTENLELLRISASEIEVDKICEKLNSSLENSNVTIDKHFFEHPNKLPILEEVKKPLIEWLVWVNLNKAEATALSNRFPSYFLFALNEEWKLHSKDYECLITLNTPFTKASEQEKAWLYYSAKLQKQIDEPMFGEVFSLKQIYVPLRAYYEEKNENKNKSKRQEKIEEIHDEEPKLVVCDLYKELEVWLEQSDKNDSVRIISGGPGSGKSSFCKVFAALQSAKGNRRVLFIPLHQYKFDLTDDLIEAIENYFRFEPLLPETIVNTKDEVVKWLFVFDGLDELTMQGRIATEIAQQFVYEVRQKVVHFNVSSSRLKVLISGRQLAVDANKNEFRKSRQIMHVLPYYITQSEQVQRRYHDPQYLLQVDQRQTWWKAYGIAIGKEKDYPQMPRVLQNRDDLTDITTQPLLNYLVALSLKLGNLDFSKTINLNVIYADLLRAVYERGWAESPHPALKGVEEDQFVRFLEEIALSAWHGDGRTTTVKEIESHCKDSGLNDLLMGLQEGATKGVTRLLMAFYFRQSGHRDTGDKTFEFTHKTFGEYLTAKCIVRNLDLISEEVRRNKSKKYLKGGWDERTALAHWIRLFGVIAIDRDLFRFIVREIELQPKNTVKEWQNILINMINFMLHHGMPMERLEPRPSFQQECYQSRNSEEALMIILNACASVTKEISDIDWPTRLAFGEWCSKMQYQRVNYRNTIFFDCLSWLSLKNSILLIKDLYKINCSLSNLEDANLEDANLEDANLEDANLENANLSSTNLKKANLKKANLKSANLRSANLENANLSDTNLEKASLKRTNLKRAILERAILSAANLSAANLSAANLCAATLEDANLYAATLEIVNLKSANLKGANLSLAKLLEANLHYANLGGASLEGANLYRANLQSATLERANLQRANLQSATLEDANLQSASLERANLQNASLERANLQNASLERANLQNASLNGAVLQGANLQGAIWINGRRCAKGSIGKLVFETQNTTEETN